MYARDTNDRSHLRRRAASTGKPSWRAAACVATDGSLARPACDVPGFSARSSLPCGYSGGD